jgi:hypothetical protein
MDAFLWPQPFLAAGLLCAWNRTTPRALAIMGASLGATQLIVSCMANLSPAGQLLLAGAVTLGIGNPVYAIPATVGIINPAPADPFEAITPPLKEIATTLIVLGSQALAWSQIAVAGIAAFASVFRK